MKRGGQSFAAASMLLKMERSNWSTWRNLTLGYDLNWLLDAIDEALRQILDRPLSAPVLLGWTESPTVRSMRVLVFPYRVLYYVSDTSIVILAYAHHRRKPGDWHQRMWKPLTRSVKTEVRGYISLCTRGGT